VLTAPDAYGAVTIGAIVKIASANSAARAA
jgi:hypothetical protein